MLRVSGFGSLGIDGAVERRHHVVLSITSVLSGAIE
jgi:hypothetical protein